MPGLSAEQTLALVLGLLVAEDLLVEVALQLLVGPVDAELFERVPLKDLEAEDIED